MNKSFPRLRMDFKSFEWDITPYDVKEQFISIQTFPHFKPYNNSPGIIYFNLDDFHEMKGFDWVLSDNQDGGLQPFIKMDLIQKN